MAEFDLDLFVIGGGSGGVRAARVAAEAGARVGLAEEYRYGGTCVIRGCVPKKLMVIASTFATHFEDAHGFGWDLEPPRFDWPRFTAALGADLSRLESIYRDNLRKAGVQLHGSRAVLVDAHRVRLATGAEYSAKHILVATGAKPFVPDVEGVDLAITSNEMFDLESRPERLAIVGGGYIACEFASIMNGLGSRVLQLYRGDQILRGFDDDVRDHVADLMRRRGVSIEIQRDVCKIERVDGGLRLTLDNSETHVVDKVLYATGRVPNTEGLGLEALGVELAANGAVTVDRWSQTGVPSIYAVGDVTDRVQLTPVAIREGHAFACTVFGAKPAFVDHETIPSAVFTQPEIGTIGATEAEARKAGEVEIYRTVFRPMPNVLAGRDERMMMKLVVEMPSRRVVGCHIVGLGAAEMIQMAAVAIRMGATKEDFDATVAVHPTAAEELVTMGAPVLAPERVPQGLPVG